MKPIPCPNGGRVLAPRWSHDQIRSAHLAFLAPLLRRQDLRFIERPANNLALPAYPGLLVKDSYWRCPEHHLAGNAIDFCVQVLGLIFAQAMRDITGA